MRNRFLNKATFGNMRSSSELVFWSNGKRKICAHTGKSAFGTPADNDLSFKYIFVKNTVKAFLVNLSKKTKLSVICYSVI